jgi:hypothetical protein
MNSSSIFITYDLTRLHGSAQGRMVPFGLIGVSLREVGDRAVEALALAQVGGDLHPVAARNGSAARSEALFCARFVPTVIMMMRSEGISEISRSPVLNAVAGSAFCRVPSHSGVRSSRGARSS